MNPSPPRRLGLALRSIWSSALARLVVARRQLTGQRRERRLRLRETLSLGERRFLAVVEFQQQEFLVGGTGSSIALLTRLSPEPASPAIRGDDHSTPWNLEKSS
jgi:flagellar biogenesis protein FliO